MIKPHKPLPLNIMILALIIWFMGTGIRIDDPFMDELKSRLIQYNKDFHVEKTYLVTDRFVYRPGEDLWFTGFVSSSGNLNQQVYSEDFFIRLIDSKGEEIVCRRYPMVNSQATGRIAIPRSSIPGKYWLVAYSSWMKNMCPRETFRKEILISKYFEKRFKVEMIMDRVFYAPNDTFKAAVRILDPSGKPIVETPFEYMIGTVNKTLIKGNDITDIKGKARISLPVPQSEEVLMISLEIERGKYSGDFSQVIPTLVGVPNIEFFPEGGNMVEGLSNNLALKACNKYGMPLIISGEIVDHAGKVIRLVHTNQQGQAVFEHTPLSDPYFLQIVAPEGLSRKYPLPDAKPDGMVIQLRQLSSDSAILNIRSSDQLPQTVFMVAVLEKQVVWSRQVHFRDSARVSVPIKDFQAGIMQITVFDQGHNFIAERLIHVDKGNDLPRIRTDHQVYHNRQRVNLLVEFPQRLNQTTLTLSVSLNSLAHNVLVPDFKTYIHTNLCETDSLPSGIFDWKTDLDLLTAHYRMVDWKDIMGQHQPKSPYVKYDGLAGSVFDRKENPAQHAKVRITHFPNLRSYETQTDEQGIFNVNFGSDIIDYKYLDIDAYDAMGKISLNTSIDQKFFEEFRKSILFETKDMEKQKVWDVISYAEPDLVYMLRYGPGKFKKTEPDSRKKYDPNQYAKYTDILDIIQDIRPYRLVNEKIIFSDGAVSESGQMPEAIMVINGKLKGDNIHALKDILPSDITNINISNSSLDVHKYTPLNFSAVIEITTIQGMSRYRQNPVQIGPGILNTGREFYSPDYAVEGSSSADNRKTLYWNSKIPFNPGNPMLVSFYTSDVKGVFYGRLVGVDNTGNPIEYEFTFKVE